MAELQGAAGGGLKLRRLRAGDGDLASVAHQLNSKDFYEGVQDFTAETLETFLKDDSNICIIATLAGKVVGGVHAYVLQHPDGRVIVYIDEVDTIAPFRRRGAAKAMMEETLRIARECGATETWVGTEEENTAAMALYRSLKPYEEESSIIFSYKPKDTDGQA